MTHQASSVVLMRGREVLRKRREDEAQDTSYGIDDEH